MLLYDQTLHSGEKRGDEGFLTQSNSTVRYIIAKKKKGGGSVLPPSPLLPAVCVRRNQAAGSHWDEGSRRTVSDRRVKEAQHTPTFTKGNNQNQLLTQTK